MNYRVPDVSDEVHFDLAHESSSVVLFLRLKIFELKWTPGLGLELRLLGDKLLFDIIFVKRAVSEFCVHLELIGNWIT